MKKQQAQGSNKLSWRVNTPALLKEILNNPGTGILRQPLRIFGNVLSEVGDRASQINDPQLNKLMLRLSIYAEGDAYEKDFDQKVYDEAMKVPNDEYVCLREHAPELLETLKQFVHSVEHEGSIHGRVAQSLEDAKKVIKKAIE